MLMLLLLLTAVIRFPAEAFAEIKYVVKNIPVQDSAGVYIETVSELYGKKNDNGFKLMEGMSQSNKVICVADSSEIYQYNYLVFEASFAPVEGLSSITLQTAEAKQVSYSLTEGWNNNRWNNIRIVCEGADSDSRCGYATFYINGQAKLVKTPLISRFKKNLRISFNGIPGKERLRLYIENYSIYFSDTDPGAPEIPMLENRGIRSLFSCMYMIKPGLTCGELLFGNASTRVYAGGNYSSLRADSELAVNGDTVAAEKENGDIYYYEIKTAEDKNTLCAVSENFDDGETAITVKNCSAAVENGKLRVTNLNNISEAELCFSVPDANQFDYLELRADVFPETVSGLQVMTNRGKNLSPRLYTLNGELERNKWSSLRVLYDSAASKISVFLNGLEICETKTEKIGTGTEYKDLKIVLFGKADSTAYIDNYAVNYIFEPDSGISVAECGEPRGAAAEGIFGKKTTDKSLYTAVTDRRYYRTNYTVKPKESYAYYKYLVYDINIAPVSGMKAVYLQTKGSALVSADKVTDGFKEKQWNNFRFVYEMPTVKYPAGRTTCYLNGTAVFADSVNLNAFADNEVRVAIDSTVTEKLADRQDLYVYIDDINVYMTDIAPGAPKMPVLPQQYSVCGGVMTLYDRIRAVDITADGMNVRAYRNEVPVPQNEELASGDTIIIETGEKAGELKYTVYTVQLSVPEHFDEFAEIAVPTSAVKEAVTGFAGKTAEDKLYKVVINGSAGNIKKAWNNIGTYGGYLIVEGNAYINAGKFSVNFGNTHTLEYDKCGNWFHFAVVADGSKTENNVAAYVDGKQIGICTLRIPQNAEIRLRLAGKSGDSVIFDDVSLYTQKSAPDIIQPPTLPDLLFGKYVNGFNKTAADFCGENISAAAFESNNLNSAAENAGVLHAGEYLLIYDKQKRIYGGYTVANFGITGNEIIYNRPGAAAAVIAEYSGERLIAVKTYNPKDGADIAYKPIDVNNSVKIFTIDSIAGIKPLEEAIYIKRVSGAENT